MSKLAYLKTELTFEINFSIKCNFYELEGKKNPVKIGEYG